MDFTGSAVSGPVVRLNVTVRFKVTVRIYGGLLSGCVMFQISTIILLVHIPNHTFDSAEWKSNSRT
jgi:hypothetical protein